jgi:hypothetical protein
MEVDRTLAVGQPRLRKHGSGNCRCSDRPQSIPYPQRHADTYRNACSVLIRRAVKRIKAQPLWSRACTISPSESHGVHGLFTRRPLGRVPIESPEVSRLYCNRENTLLGKALVVLRGHRSLHPDSSTHSLPRAIARAGSPK